MLNSAHIQNFRLFKNFQIDNLARVNLIVGKNNVGKSSLLEAINLLNSSQPVKSLYALLESRNEIVLNGNHDDQSGYEFIRLFNNTDKKNDVVLKNTENQLTIRWRNNFFPNVDFCPPGFGVDFDDNFDDNPDVFMPSSGIFVDTKLPKQASKEFDSRPPCIFIAYPNLHYQQFVSAWDDIQLTPSESNVVKFLQIIEPAIERIANQQTNGRFMVRSKNFSTPVPLKSFGNGISAIFGISLGLAQAENGYLLIDEIEAGLHYQELAEVWQAIMETAVRLNIQVFATTHSWDCVESFAEALEMQGNSDVGALFRLERREDDQIAAVKYTAPDLATAAKQGIEVR